MNPIVLDTASKKQPVQPSRKRTDKTAADQGSAPTSPRPVQQPRPNGGDVGQ